MPLNKTTLTNSLKDAMKNRMLAKSITPDSGQLAEMEALAGDMADAIDNYIKTADIIYIVGLVAPSGGGAVTAIGPVSIANLQ